MGVPQRSSRSHPRNAFPCERHRSSLRLQQTRRRVFLPSQRRRPLAYPRASCYRRSSVQGPPFSRCLLCMCLMKLLQPLGQLISNELASLPPGGVPDIRLPQMSAETLRIILSFIYGSSAPPLPLSVEGSQLLFIRLLISTRQV